MAASREIQEIWDECKLELEANRQMGEDLQYLAEEAIGNAAALQSLNDSPNLVELVKNL